MLAVSPLAPAPQGLGQLQAVQVLDLHGQVRAAASHGAGAAGQGAQPGRKGEVSISMAELVAPEDWLWWPGAQHDHSTAAMPSW